MFVCARNEIIVTQAFFQPAESTHSQHQRRDDDLNARTTEGQTDRCGEVHEVFLGTADRGMGMLLETRSNSLEALFELLLWVRSAGLACQALCCCLRFSVEVLHQKMENVSGRVICPSQKSIKDNTRKN